MKYVGVHKQGQGCMQFHIKYLFVPDITFLGIRMNFKFFKSYCAILIYAEDLHWSSVQNKSGNVIGPMKWVVYMWLILKKSSAQAILYQFWANGPTLFERLDWSK